MASSNLSLASTAPSSQGGLAYQHATAVLDELRRWGVLHAKSEGKAYETCKTWMKRMNALLLYSTQKRQEIRSAAQVALNSGAVGLLCPLDLGLGSLHSSNLTMQTATVEFHSASKFTIAGSGVPSSQGRARMYPQTLLPSLAPAF